MGSEISVITVDNWCIEIQLLELEVMIAITNVIIPNKRVFLLLQCTQFYLLSARTYHCSILKTTN